MRPNWFIGWPVEPGAWFGPLVSTAPAPLRRFHPEDLHVTLAFLGPVSEEGALAAWVVAESLPLRPVTGKLGKVVGFGNPRAPSAFSLEVHGDAIREDIGAYRGALYAAADARPDDRLPRAHCTVARPRREASGLERAQGLAWASHVPPLNREVLLDRLALYTWSEDRRARQFQRVRERRLQPR